MRTTPGAGTHLPVLIKLVQATTGPIAEVGGGLYSTPFLHWACFDKKRELATFENNPTYYKIAKQYGFHNHKVIFVEDWYEADLERYWDIVLIDHAPGERRAIDAIRVANYARYVVLHDTEERTSKEYGYERIYPHFKYIYQYTGAKPYTTVLSNFDDLKWMQQ